MEADSDAIFTTEARRTLVFICVYLRFLKFMFFSILVGMAALTCHGVGIPRRSPPSIAKLSRTPGEQARPTATQYGAIEPSAVATERSPPFLLQAVPSLPQLRALPSPMRQGSLSLTNRPRLIARTQKSLTE